MINSKDQKLIDILNEGSSTIIPRYKELADELKTRPSSVRKKIENFKKIGVIERFLPYLNASRLGYGQTGLIQISVKPREYINVGKKLATLPELESIFGVSGRYDIIAKFRVKNKSDIVELITHKIYSIEGVTETVTNIVGRTFKENGFVFKTFNENVIKFSPREGEIIKTLMNVDRDISSGRAKIYELLGTSRSTLYRKIKKFMEKDVICAFVPKINWEKTRRNFTTIILLNTEIGNFEEVCDKLIDLPFIYDLYKLFGIPDLAALMRVKNISEWNNVVNSVILPIEGITSTESLMVPEMFKFSFPLENYITPSSEVSLKEQINFP